MADGTGVYIWMKFVFIVQLRPFINHLWMLDSTSARWLGAILNSEITNKKAKSTKKVV